MEEVTRMVKVVVISGGKLVLLRGEDLVKGIHGEEADPRHA